MDKQLGSIVDMLDKEQVAYLKQIYYDPENQGAYGGIDRLYKYVQDEGKYKLSKQQITNWLQGEENYSFFASKKKAKNFYPIVSPYANYQIDVDTGYLRTNGRRSLFILAVDVFSRKIAARSVLNLKAQTVKNALTEILSEYGSIEKIRTDLGTELNNQLVSQLLKEKGINHILAFPPLKASQAERHIREVKKQLYKIVHKTGKKDWHKHLQSVVKAHNKRKLPALHNHTPNEVNNDNTLQQKLWFEFKRAWLKRAPPPKPFKYKVGDAVRYKLSVGLLGKDFEQKNSTAVYFITQRLSPNNIARYKLKTYDNKVLEGTFTENQLQQVHIDSETKYRIKDIVQRRTKNGIKQARVRWEGYTSNDDTWMDESEIDTIQ
jgi:hypothetical protein